MHILKHEVIRDHLPQTITGAKGIQRGSRLMLIKVLLWGKIGEICGLSLMGSILGKYFCPLPDWPISRPIRWEVWRDTLYDFFPSCGKSWGFSPFPLSSSRFNNIWGVSLSCSLALYSRLSIWGEEKIILLREGYGNFAQTRKPLWATVCIVIFGKRKEKRSLPQMSEKWVGGDRKKLNNG